MSTTGVPLVPSNVPLLVDVVIKHYDFFDFWQNEIHQFLVLRMRQVGIARGGGLEGDRQTVRETIVKSLRADIRSVRQFEDAGNLSR